MKRKKKNRKKYNAVIRGYGSLCFTVILLLAMVASLGYIWLGSRTETLGEEIKQLESRGRGIRQQLDYEESRWARMCSMPGIRRALNRFNIDMQLPDRSRVVYVRPVSLQPTGGRPADYSQYARVRGHIRHE